MNRLCSSILLSLTLSTSTLIASKITEDTNLYEKAPMPGMITHINVKPGDSVQAGEVIFRMEAMKMECFMRAKAPGVIGSLNFKIGDIVQPGDIILNYGNPEAEKKPLELSKEDIVKTEDIIKVATIAVIASNNGSPPTDGGNTGNSAGKKETNNNRNIERSEYSEARRKIPLISNPYNNLGTLSEINFTKNLSSPIHEKSNFSLNRSSFSFFKQMIEKNNYASKGQSLSFQAGDKIQSKEIKNYANSTYKNVSPEFRGSKRFFNIHIADFVEHLSLKKSFFQIMKKYIYETLFDPMVGLLVSIMAMFYSLTVFLQYYQSLFFYRLSSFVRIRA